MEQGTFDFTDEPVPVKLCECGCGEPAPIATWSNTQRGYVKGEPKKFIHGHHGRGKPSPNRKAPVDLTPSPEKGLCQCGCGQPAPIAAQTNRTRGWVKGQAKRFIKNHHLPKRALFVKVGQRIGRGVVIDPDVLLPPTPRRKGVQRAARLVCDCNGRNEYVVYLSNLLGKKPTQSCGCLNRERVSSGRAHSERVRRLPEGRAARNSVLGGYRHGARKRGLAWELTDEDFDRLTAENCFYCGSPPACRTKRVKSVRHYNGDFVYNGIDRIDNAVGYIPGNVLPCCGICNKAKRDLPFDDFLVWIARLVEHHWFHPDLMPSRLLREVKGL